MLNGFRIIFPSYVLLFTNRLRVEVILFPSLTISHLKWLKGPLSLHKRLTPIELNYGLKSNDQIINSLIVSELFQSTLHYLK
jgi:hypothetical protein